MNWKAGIARTWVAVSLLWLCCGTYVIISSHLSWSESFQAGKTFAELSNKDRKQITSDILAKGKESDASLRKLGIKISMDEVQAENAAYVKAWEIVQNSENFKLKEECFHHAYASRDRRDLFSKILIIPPMILAVVAALSLWVAKGFKRAF